MSEDEFEYESDIDIQSGSESDDRSVMLESLFYEAEDLIATDPTKALELFRTFIREIGDNSREPKLLFRAFAWVVVLSCKTLQTTNICTDLAGLFSWIPQVTRNDAADGLNQVIDALSCQSGMDKDSLCRIYEGILDRLWEQGPGLQRLWFTTAVRLCRLYLEDNHGKELDNLLAQMASTCKQSDGHTDDIIGKGSQLLELYAIEIQRICAAHSAEGGYRKVKVILEKCNRANSAVSNPRSMAIIREYAGKIFMSENRFEDAYNELFEAFKAYADTGNLRAKLVLKYLVLANMFCLSMINPFDSREARAYQDDPEVNAMVRLRAAYDSKDISKVESVLEDAVFQSAIDEFMHSYLDQLMYAIKLEALQKLVKVYVRVKISSLGRQLHLEDQVVQRMVIKSIQDGHIDGLIEGGDLIIKPPSGDDPRVLEAQALLDTVVYLKKTVMVDLQSKWKENIGSTAN